MTEPDFTKARTLLLEGAEKAKDLSIAMSELAEWLERVARELKR